MSEQKPIQNFLSRNLRLLSISAAILIFLVIVLGGILRVTGSGGACPDWPTCFGGWTVPVQETARLDYAHRAVTGLLAPVLLLAVLAAYWQHQPGVVFKLLAAAMGLLIGQVGLGAWIALVSAPQGAPAVSALHLGLSLAILALTTAATVVVFSQERLNGEPLRASFSSPFGRLTLWAIGLMFILLVSGGLVAGSGAGAACAAWPICNPLQSPGDPVLWLHFGHRLLVGLAAALLLVLLVRAWRTQRTQPVILTAATAMVVLFFAQALLGARLSAGFPAALLGLHQATASATWAAAVVLASAVGLARRSLADELADRALAIGRKGLVKDFLMLTKPIVVALLLVTTFAGMVIGAQAWPSAGLVFWTLLGGFMAAGGSGAINQYIDRTDDSKMQRTQKRPIPSGRVTPAEGLAFGVGIALASFYITTAFVNLLAALLSLAGIIYYVLIYSIFLKKTTVQNIVIGGGAGAIPPLVGWAAATGSLNIPSLFLFAVIFMWTPPHFWALALVRRKDYARAGVPMLPVIRGEKETRWQIFVYTLELVGLTLLLPLFGLGGSIYLGGAALLGLWLLSSAWKVWKEGGNKLAWKMYRYSSMYLAFIFIVLMVDRLM